MVGWRSEEGAGTRKVVGAETPRELEGREQAFYGGHRGMLLELNASSLGPVFRNSPIPSDQGGEAAATEELELVG